MKHVIVKPDCKARRSWRDTWRDDEVTAAVGVAVAVDAVGADESIEDIFCIDAWLRCTM